MNIELHEQGHRGGVYLIRNTQAGMVYVGSARCLSTRAKWHAGALKNGYHTNPLMMRDAKRHGHGSFSFEVVATIPDETERLAVEERVIASLYGSDCYNVAVTTHAPCGLPFTQEHRDKIGAWHRGRPKTPEQRAKISASLTGRKVSEEARVAAIDGRRGYRHSAETKARISAGQMGNKRGPISDEHRAKIVAGLKAAWARKRSVSWQSK